MNPIIGNIGRTAALAAVLGLAACASSGSGEAPAFPDPGSATFAGGTYPNLDNLRAVAPGTSKDQLYDLLGRPHFREGVFGVREWDYLFNFRDGDGGATTCQFKILFDDAGLARSTHWSPAACDSVLEPADPLAGMVITSGHDVVTERRVVLSADATFAFGRAELSGQGRRAIDDAMARIDGSGDIDSVRIVGHADRIGSDAANDAISLRRAEAVRDYLLQRGLPRDAIGVESRGSRDPVVHCDQSARAALIACLSPNRRVEVLLRRSSASREASP